MKTCTILTILCVSISFRVETKNLSSEVNENPLALNGENKNDGANLERTMAELSDVNHDVSNSEEMMSENLNALAYEIGLLKKHQLKSEDKIKSLEDEITLLKNQTMIQEKGLHSMPVLPFV